MTLTVGTRGSALSLIQTRLVVDMIRAVAPEIEVKERVIRTLGDRELRKPLFQIKAKGIFEKEIDLAVLRGEVDFAVHSLKDLPIGEQHDLVLAAVPKRESPNDVLVSRDGSRLSELAPSSTVGTSSLRRMAQLKHIRPDIEVRPIRGNVESRIRKVDAGEFGAVILAEAGLVRMGLEGRIRERLPIEDFTPAAGQGAMAVVARKDSHEVLRLLRYVDDPSSRAEVTAERTVVNELGGGCRVPIGVVARSSGEKLRLYACTFSVDGRRKVSSSAEGDLTSPEELGKGVAQDLARLGAMELAHEWREKYGEW